MALIKIYLMPFHAHIVVAECKQLSLDRQPLAIRIREQRVGEQSSRILELRSGQGSGYFEGQKAIKPDHAQKGPAHRLESEHVGEPMWICRMNYARITKRAELTPA